MTKEAASTGRPGGRSSGPLAGQGPAAQAPAPSRMQLKLTGQSPCSVGTNGDYDDKHQPRACRYRTTRAPTTELIRRPRRRHHRHGAALTLDEAWQRAAGPVCDSEGRFCAGNYTTWAASDYYYYSMAHLCAMSSAHIFNPTALLSLTGRVVYDQGSQSHIVITHHQHRNICCHTDCSLRILQ